MDLSIVVPVYNVENYVEKCVKSLLSQTVKGFQIVLVDDGSTDKSGVICDELSEKNDNVLTYHKKNGGLSDARNYGVKKAQGNYISFVDSDDTVREDYVEKLYGAIIEKHVDIAVADYQQVDESFCYEYTATPNHCTLIDSEELLKDSLLGKKGSLTACAKIFKKDILKKYPFPYGKLYEDMEVVYLMLRSVSKVAYIDEKLYFYLMRKNSIVHSRVTERHKYGLESCIRILEHDKTHGGELEFYISCRIVNQACGYLPNLVHYNDDAMFKEMAEIIKPYTLNIVLSNKAPLKLRVRALSYLMPKKIGLRYAYLLFEGKKLVVKRGRQG